MAGTNLICENGPGRRCKLTTIEEEVEAKEQVLTSSAAKPVVEGSSDKWYRLSNGVKSQRARRWKVDGQSMGCVPLMAYDTLSPVKLKDPVFDWDVCSVSSVKSAAIAEVSLANEQVEVLIDTGASVSLINADFARSRNLLVKNPMGGVTLRVANNRTVEVIGTTKLEVRLGKTPILHEYVVVESLIHNVILGADMLRRESIDILFSEMCLLLRGERIPMRNRRSYVVNALSESLPSDQTQLDGSLDASETIRLKELVDEYSDIFSKHDEDIGDSDFIHRIELSEYKPIRSRAYRIPHSQKTVESEEIKKMIRMGVIQQSNSDFTSPIVIVRKKDNSNRFCIDFRKLNAITVKDNYPMPLIEERLESLRGKGIFSSLDLTSGYWQFAVEPSSRKLTAFISHEGVFEFTRMPFGLCNAGATFQRAMEQMLVGIECAIAYIDDIMTSSIDFNTHMGDLRRVFDVLRKHKLKMKARKCVFGARETKFLGFLVSKEGIRVCPSRSDCIRNYPQPRNVRNIREFLGLASYYRKFIRGFAHIAAPLSKLTQKGIAFIWSADCEKAFRKLINRLLNPPVLRFPDFKKRFRLSTDASNVGIGAVLFQTDEDGNEHVIAYASRGLTSAERNYNTTEKELLAIIWAIDRFRPYLYGVEFDLITNHTYVHDRP